ncbi:MAG TPA: hypothetical protein VF765_19030 [Polyangiaceae bacterium]
MRLPTRLAFTAFHVAVAGTLACSAKTDGGSDPPADAAPDVRLDAAVDVAADVADSSTHDVATRDVTPVDANIVDASTDVSDGGDQCDSPNYYCGPATQDADCPGYVCDLSECSFEAGCEPFV